MHRLLTQRVEALRVVDPSAHRLAVLQEQLREATIEHTRLQHHTQFLQDRLSKTEARLEALRREAPGEAA
ncbi:hypothetical protein OG280_40855 (plasmid) [Streptomyces virginiae]|uniref:hypothetical protein n=1 Tax=Streptomyces virginiae TaxID=1961 RepID=UPI002DD9B073|nr:hypothetical protein [Streptomyces virginiae]WSC82753.1 hypothetical protein OHA56_40860 [Streptomyces virginiae]